MNKPGKRQLLRIDGSMGEGGGQILRSALALSLCLGKPFRMTRIRAARRKPGLQPQHLAAVRAAAAIGTAEVTGAVQGSDELTFIPQAVQAGSYRFATGTAGSAALVLQTVLPALLTAARPTQLELSGGTHNPLAPPFDFIERAFLPLVNRMGPRVTARLLQPGFYPAGGGIMQVSVEPARRLVPLELTERGALLRQSACAVLSHLPRHIAERELGVIAAGLGLCGDDLQVQEISTAAGPGNVLTVSVESEHVTEVFTGFGMPGVRAETVADGVVQAVQRYLAAGVPVGEHLADQLLLPLALAGGGCFDTLQPSRHATTNIAVLQQFMAVAVDCEERGPDRWRIRLH